MPDHNELMRIRHDKLKTLEESSVETYPATSETTNSLSTKTIILMCHEYKEDSEDSVQYSVNPRGRIRSMRRMGNMAFFDLHDESGKIQIVCFKKEMPESFSLLKDSILDIGDIVSVEGVTYVTKSGEESVRAEKITLLSKAIRPLPEKREGLKDTELQYREREVHLIMDEEARSVFRTRTEVMNILRVALYEKGFMEVETPMLHPISGGATAKPFITHHNALDQDLYLRIAPELYLKRLLVGGFEKIYEINRSFRNEGISTRHNPEFTMLELYAAYKDCSWMIVFVEELLINHFNFTGLFYDSEKLHRKFQHWTMLQALDIYGNIDVDWQSSIEEVRQQVPSLPDDITNVDDAIVWAFEEIVEPLLAKIDAPIFITEFPKSHSPLAKSIEGKPHIADRFELYIGGMEIANGYSELNNPGEQYRIFVEQAKALGKTEADIDLEYIRALEYGMPPAAGLGIGIDRLVMLLTEQKSIKNVIFFPTLKRESS